MGELNKKDLALGIRGIIMTNTRELNPNSPQHFRFNNFYEATSTNDEPEMDVHTRAHFAQLKERWLKPLISNPLQAPDQLEKGQIWLSRFEVLTSAGEKLGEAYYIYPVLIVDAGDGSHDPSNVIWVIPISVDVDFDWPGRSLQLPTNNPLNHSVLVEFFNERPMLVANLGEFRGCLTSEQLAKCEQGRKTCLNRSTETPDIDVALWQERELDLAYYLSKPVYVEFELEHK
jgi:hypothetical protein